MDKIMSKSEGKSVDKRMNKSIEDVIQYYTNMMSKTLQPSQTVTYNDSSIMLNTVLSSGDLLSSDSHLDCSSVVVGEGIHGRVFVCKYTSLVNKNKYVIIKQSIDPIPKRFYFTLYECFINLWFVKDHSHFPRLLSIIVCSPNQVKNAPTFCKHSTTLTTLNKHNIEADLISNKLQLFPVFERVDGNTLADFLSNHHQKLSMPVIKSLLGQVLLICDSLNRGTSRFTHNDLHIKNIMVTLTSETTFTFLGSDNRKRTLPSHGWKILIIDLGYASAYKSGMLATFSRPICQLNDVFKFLTTVYKRCLQTQSQEVNRFILEMIFDIFGKPMFSLLQKKDIYPSFYSYVAHIWESIRNASTDEQKDELFLTLKNASTYTYLKTWSLLTVGDSIDSKEVVSSRPHSQIQAQLSMSPIKYKPQVNLPSKYIKDGKMPGLWFDENTFIHQLSGPVSLYLLTPSNLDMVYRPPVLIFGDFHLSMTNMCNPCESSMHCYSIGQTQLFELLNRFSTMQDSIDVFLEYFDTPEQKEDFVAGLAGGPMADTIKYAENCFRAPRYRRPDALPCPSPNLKWHMIDIRHGSFFEETAQRQRPSVELLIAQMYDPNILVRFVVDPHDPIRESILRILRSLYDPVKNVVHFDRFISTFVDEIMTPGVKSRSLIAKQVRKQKLTMSNDMLKRLFRHCMKVHVESLTKTQRMLDQFKQSFPDSDSYSQFLENFFNWEYQQKQPKRLEYMVFFFNAFVDVYTVLRMFKSASTSVLSVIYCGEAHALSMTHVLQQIYNYRLIYSQPEDNMNRCLTVTQSINMKAIMNDAKLAKNMS